MRATNRLRRLASLVTGWESWIFATDDAAAWTRGWEVSRRSSGFGRVYRDPRWDLISACDLCGGSGGGVIEPCQPCGGTGTIRQTADTIRQTADTSQQAADTGQQTLVHTVVGGVS